MAFLNQEEDENQQNAPQVPQPPSVGPSSAPISTPQAPQPKGSGRFTNIQKYIGANQGAGSRLATGVGKKVESQINPELQKTQTQNQAIADQVNKAQGILGQGQAIKSQVEDTNFDAQGFAAQEPNVQQFNQFRTGQALDETTLRNQAQTAQLQAQAAQAKAQALGQQFGSEQGRQQLLKQTFSPGRNYSIGQQRLDNLFLQQASPEIKNIQGNIGQAAQQLGSLNTQLGTQAKTIEDLAKEEAGITSGIQSGISAREQDLLNAITDPNRVKATNEARFTQQKMARDQFGNLVEGKNINQDFANQMGLTNQDRLFNVLKNNANIDDYLKFNDTMLTGADQLANQQERAKYDAIARLAGIDPTNRQINLNTQVANAVDSTGLLRKNIDDKTQDYLNSLQDKFTFTGRFGGRVGKLADLEGKKYGEIASLAEQLNDTQKALGNDAYYFQRLNGGLDSSLQNLVNQVGGNIENLRNDGNSSLVFNDRGRASFNDMIRYQALVDTYNKLANEGYFQNVNIDDPTLEKAPKVT